MNSSVLDLEKIAITTITDPAESADQTVSELLAQNMSPEIKPERIHKHRCGEKEH